MNQQVSPRRIVPDGRPHPNQPGAADVHALARDAAIQALIATDAPIASADAIAAVVAGDALRAVVAARAEIFAAGHTPDADLMFPIPWLPFEAQQHAAMAGTKIGLTAADRDLPAAEHELALAAAFCMAALDRLRSARERREA